MYFTPKIVHILHGEGSQLALRRRMLLILNGEGGLRFSWGRRTFCIERGTISHGEGCSSCTEKGAYFTRRRVHVLHGEGGLFCTQKCAHFTRRSGPSLQRERCFFRRERGPVLHGKMRTCCSEKRDYFCLEKMDNFCRRRGPLL